MGAFDASGEGAANSLGRFPEQIEITMREFIPVAEPDLRGHELDYVVDCVKTNWISSLGKYVTEFESGFSRFCDTKYGIAVANGTVALHLALSVLDIGPEDEVIIPSLTFVATANAVIYTGARPVFADSEPGTWNIDPQQLESLVTPRTRAIIPVHLYGHPADMDPILEIARRYGLYVIEDAAEAHGAQYKGQVVGSFGDIGCFSFYGNKIVTTGEGGMLVTNDPSLAEKARILRDHAMSPEQRFWHLYVGFNYRMTNLQAAIGVAQLERIDELLDTRRRMARLYSEFLSGTQGIRLHPEAAWARNVFWLYSVLIEDEFGISRDELMAGLRANGIDSRPFFYPIHIQPPYTRYKTTTLPIAERLSQQGVNLPSSTLLTEEEIEYVAGTIHQLQRRRGL